MRFRSLNLIITVAVTLLLGAGLTATIYWTLFDPKWIVFLGGVLFSAVIAMASQTSKAQWLIMRRTKQLERIREQMAHETDSSRRAQAGAELAVNQMRILGDLLPDQVFYIDREGFCEYRNSAAERRSELNASGTKERTAKAVLGAAYPHVAVHVSEVLSGKRLRYEFKIDSQTYYANQIPCPDTGGYVHGYYLLLAPRFAAPQSVSEPATATIATEAATPAFSVESSESGETLYLRSVADELMGWDDPRSKLEAALRNDEFLLFGQGMAALKSGLADPRCIEVLLRLREEEDNLLPPGGFIPVAERYNMMEQLDRWVIKHVLALSAGMSRSPLFCINLSEQSLCSEDFVRFLQYETGQGGFSPASICFEIGEPDIIAHHGHAQRLINTLRPLGFKFTVDAFGSVKVSFTHLRGLAIHAVKIDGVIIQNILRDNAELAKLRAIGTVCQKFNLRTIAEFVESPETVQALKKVEIDYAQGFGIARPAPIEQALADME